MRLRSRSWAATAVTGVLILAAGWLGLYGVASATTGTATAWGPAQPLPVGPPISHYARVTAISCPTPGNCSAAGTYYTAPGFQAFVIDQKDGVWGSAQPVPGLAALNAGVSADVTSISCASPGNCAAGGYYSAADGAGTYISRDFVVDEVNGTWSNAHTLPPPVAVTPVGAAVVRSVSCSAPGDCVAGGYDATDQKTTAAFVVDEIDGTWGAPVQISGATTLDQVDSVSCAAPGECVAGLADVRQGEPAALATESGGIWSAAEPVPGLATLVSGEKGARIYSVSCPSVGNCTAAGDMLVLGGASPLFVVDEANGTWGNARELYSQAYGAGSIEPDQVPLSCPSPGNCAVAGSENPRGGFIANEVNGTWNTNLAWAYPVLPAGGGATVTAVSCASAGNCSAGGYVQTGPETLVPFLMDETDGTWGTAIQVVDTTSGTVIEALSCASADICSAAGSDGVSGFLVEKGPLAPTTTAISLSARSVAYGNERAEKISATVSAATGVASGTVTVKSGAVTVCTITLADGQGSCALHETQFGSGVANLVGAYTGPAWLAPSTSPVIALTVTRAQTRTALHLSATRIRYGHEQTEKISVVVAPAFAGSVSGTVTVKAGKVTVCEISLKAGEGNCSLTARKLKIGSYRLIAGYAGNADFLGSASGKVGLTVTK